MNTLFRTERLERLLMDLKGLMTKQALPLEELFLLEGRYDREETAAAHKKEARPFSGHQQWGGRNAYYWFFTTVSLPEGFQKEPLVLRVSTVQNQRPDTALLSSFVSTPSHRWDLMNPQFLLFVNKTLRQGLDTNHTQARLKPEDYADGVLRLDFQAYTGLTDAFYGFLPELCIVDPEVEALYYDMSTLLEAALALPENSTDRLTLLDALNESANLLDLRSPGSAAFYKSLRASRTWLAEHGFGQPDQAVSVTCIGHTHIDLAWLWDTEQTRLKAQRSFATVLSLMERYPDYVFMHTSPQLFSWLKQDNPALYAQIKEKVREGRFEPEGAMWVEADCNIPCGEALVRQLVYGKQFIRKEFGLDSRVLWLPDVFGYSAAMPQLLKKAGIDCFVTSKISWNMLNDMPYDTFLWKGIDGSEILTSFITTPELGTPEGNCGATYNGVLHPETVIGAWKQYKQKEVNRDVFLCYGYGDGGGGPTAEMLEKLERLEKGVPGFPTVKTGRIQPYFQELALRMKGQKYLPKWTGELYLELHQGTYTSNANIKRNNRLAENALMAAETLQSILFAANLAGLQLQDPEEQPQSASAQSNYERADGGRTDSARAEAACGYPAAQLHNLWETLLLNQFHDILPGSCIREVYQQSELQFAELFRQTDALQRTALSRLAASVSAPADGLLLYNPSCFDRDDVLEFSPFPSSGRETGSLLFPSGPLPDGFTDLSGKPVPCQKLENGNLLAAVRGVPGLGYTQIFPFSEAAAEEGGPMPPYRVFPIGELIPPDGIFPPSYPISQSQMENAFFLLTFDEAGQISRLYDKRTGREVIEKGQTGNRLTVYDDRPRRWDSWNVDMYYEEKSWPVTELLSSEVTERGPVRYALTHRYRYHRSAIKQTIRLYSHLPRIDFLAEADWQEDSSLLKAEFPVRINADYATYEIQYGSVRRPTHANTSWDAAKYEVCAQKWADLSEGGYGVSLLNDCKYGYSIRDGRMCLTLLKAGMAPDPTVDRGTHRFTYSLFPHEGGPQEGGTVQAALTLNRQLFCAGTHRQEGALPAAIRFFSCSLPNITLDCIKMAENGDALILRFYENGNRHCNARFISWFPLSLVRETNLLEEEGDEIPLEDPHTFTMAVGPYSVNTCKITIQQEAVKQGGLS